MCPYVTPEGVCYWVGYDFKTWDAARSDCRSRDMDLAAIISEAEQNFIETGIVDVRNDGRT